MIRTCSSSIRTVKDSLATPLGEKVRPRNEGKGKFPRGQALLRVGEEAFLEREVYERAADAIGRVVLCLLGNL